MGYRVAADQTGGRPVRIEPGQEMGRFEAIIAILFLLAKLLVLMALAIAIIAFVVLFALS